MRGSVHVMTIGDIEIGVHFSWFLIFFLVAWTLAVGLFPQEVPGLGTGVYWGIGFISSFLLFVSVLIHELAHSFVAESRGLKVRGITLFIFGGVSNISGEPTNARDEFVISAVGPISSFLLGGAFYGIALVPWHNAAADAVLFYLSFINVTLAVFNLIPGFPLDGGRVLRAVVWWATNNFRQATRVAVWSGRIVGFLFVAGGVMLAFLVSLLSGIWLVLIGWFIYSIAESSWRESEEMRRFRGILVRDVMDRDPAKVDAASPLQDAVQGVMVQRGVRSVAVVEDGWLLGMVGLEDVRRIPREQWTETPVRAIMTPADRLQTVAPDANLESAVRTLAGYELEQVPVVEDGRLVGLLTQADLARTLQMRDELGLHPEDEEHRRAA